MSKLTIAGYMPDPDFIVRKDYSAKGNNFTFVVETAIVLSEDVLLRVEAAIKDEDMQTAYGIIYGNATDDMDQPGQGHAMVQAAFGIIGKNQAEANRLKRP